MKLPSSEWEKKGTDGRYEGRLLTSLSQNANGRPDESIFALFLRLISIWFDYLFFCCFCCWCCWMHLESEDKGGEFYWARETSAIRLPASGCKQRKRNAATDAQPGVGNFSLSLFLFSLPLCLSFCSWFVMLTEVMELYLAIIFSPISMLRKREGVWRRKRRTTPMKTVADESFVKK